MPVVQPSAGVRSQTVFGRSVGRVTSRAAEGAAVHIRHPQVTEDQVVRIPADERQALTPPSCGALTYVEGRTDAAGSTSPLGAPIAPIVSAACAEVRPQTYL